MLTGYGSISQAILAVPCRRHWTSYYWMVRKGKFDWKVMVHALCRIVKREFPSERCVVVGDDTLIPRVSEAAPGAAIQYDHARKPNRPDYILAQTVVSLSAVIGNSWGSWSVPLMSNLAVRTGNHGKLETMRAMVEEVSATLGAITLLLDAWYMKRYLIVDVLTRDAIVIGQVRRDTALYEPPPPRTGKPGRPRKYGDRITREKLRTLTQTHTELPIYGSHRTVRYRTAVCRARFLGGRPVRAVWVSMFVDGKWKAERLLLSTDPSHTAEDVIMTYSLRWTIEPMFAALKWGEGMIDMWMQSVETLPSMADHRPDRAGADPDAGRQGRCRDHGAGSGRSLAQGAVSHRRHGQGLVRAFWNIAPAEAWHRRGRKFDPSRRVPMRTRVVHTAIAA